MGNNLKYNELGQSFTLHGKPVTDSGLYPWALGSLGRSLLFYAETITLGTSKPLRAISAYYTLFHLGMFAMLATPKLINPKMRKKINEALKGGAADLSPSISHKYINEFLKKCSDDRFPNAIVALFEKAQKIRNFINYGPRVYWKEQKDIYIDTCQISPDSVENIVEKLNKSFVSTVDWVYSEGENDGI